MNFRAAVLHEIRRPLVVERVTRGPLGPHDVLVRLRASGLCHTELEVIESALAYPLPISAMRGRASSRPSASR